MHMSWVIYDFSFMFICLLWFCHGLPKGEIVRTYVFHMLWTYVILLCNWLILWQNPIYLYLDRSRMSLILQETCCSSLALKPWRLDQETSKEKLFIKARQIARHLQTDSSTASRHLRTDSSTPLDSWGLIEKASVSSTAPRQLFDSCIYRGLKLDTSWSIKVTGIKISKSDF